MYKISIIIPMYNSIKYISQVIESLKKQTMEFKDLEVIFSDDASNDGSVELVKKYQEQHDNIKLVTSEINNGTAGRPRNLAIQIAKANYIMFLDCDDCYTENACEVLYKEMEQDKSIDVVSGNYNLSNDKGEIYYPNVIGESIDERIYDTENELEEILRFRLSFVSKIYKKSLIDKLAIPFPGKYAGEDTVFFCRYLFLTKKVKYLNVPIFDYRIHETSVSHRCNVDYYLGLEKNFSELRQVFIENKKEAALKQILGGVVEYYLPEIIQSSIDQDGIKNIIEAWRWMFSYKEMDETDIYSILIYEFVFQSKFEEAATALYRMRPFLLHLSKINEGLEWNVKQNQSLETALKLEQKAVQSYQEAVEWNKEQNNNKDKIIEKMKEAIEWHSTQSSNKDKIIEELNEKLKMYESQI